MGFNNNPVCKGVFENLLGAAKGERNVLPQGNKVMGAAQAQGTLEGDIELMERSIEKNGLAETVFVLLSTTKDMLQNSLNFEQLVDGVVFWVAFIVALLSQIRDFFGGISVPPDDDISVESVSVRVSGDDFDRETAKRTITQFNTTTEAFNDLGGLLK